MCPGVGTEEQEAAAAAALAGLPAASDGSALGGGALCQWQARVLRDSPLVEQAGETMGCVAML